MTELHLLSQRALHLALAAEWRAGLIALLAALAAALIARMLGHRRLGAIACGVGLAAGWAWLSNLPAWPRGLADRMPEMAMIATAPAWFAGTRLFQRARTPTLVAVALLCGWWLAGAPHAVPALLRAGSVLAVLAGWTAATMLLLAEADPWRVTAAALALWAALSATGAPVVWTALALAPAAAALGAIAAPPSAGILLPAAAGIGAVVGGSMVTGGLLRYGRLGAVDFVGLAPLAAVFLAARLLPRLRRLGALAAPLAGALALAGIVLLTYVAAALVGLR